jgi:glycine/D-amino acid oxidase-like deaminating enzyme
VDPDSYLAAAEPGWLREFAERSVQRFPRLEAARSRGGWAGFYDTTPDFQFILDQAPGVPVVPSIYSIRLVSVDFRPA